jgi:hypothetical protein
MAEKKRLFVNGLPQSKPEAAPESPRIILKPTANVSRPAQQKPAPRLQVGLAAAQDGRSQKSAVVAAFVVGAVLIAILAFVLMQAGREPPVPASAVKRDSPSRPAERMWMKEYMQEHGDPEALKARKARVAGNGGGSSAR